LNSSSNGFPDLSTANIILSSFRITAPTTTFPGLPAALNLAAKSIKVGFVLRAHNAGMYNAFRILELPTLVIFDLDLTDDPDSNNRGAIPQNTSSSRLVEKCLAHDNSP